MKEEISSNKRAYTRGISPFNHHQLHALFALLFIQTKLQCLRLVLLNPLDSFGNCFFGLLALALPHLAHLTHSTHLSHQIERVKMKGEQKREKENHTRPNFPSTGLMTATITTSFPSSLFDEAMALTVGG
jgi:hypothetical protein